MSGGFPCRGKAKSEKQPFMECDSRQLRLEEKANQVATKQLDSETTKTSFGEVCQSSQQLESQVEALRKRVQLLEEVAGYRNGRGLEATSFECELVDEPDEYFVILEDFFAEYGMPGNPSKIVAVEIHGKLEQVVYVRTGKNWHKLERRSKEVAKSDIDKLEVKLDTLKQQQNNLAGQLESCEQRLEADSETLVKTGSTLHKPRSYTCDSTMSVPNGSAKQPYQLRRSLNMVGADVDEDDIHAVPLRPSERLVKEHSLPAPQQSPHQGMERLIMAWVGDTVPNELDERTFHHHVAKAAASVHSSHERNTHKADQVHQMAHQLHKRIAAIEREKGIDIAWWPEHEVGAEAPELLEQAVQTDLPELLPASLPRSRALGAAEPNTRALETDEPKTRALGTVDSTEQSSQADLSRAEIQRLRSYCKIVDAQNRRLHRELIFSETKRLEPLALNVNPEEVAKLLVHLTAENAKLREETSQLSNGSQVSGNMSGPTSPGSGHWPSSPSANNDTPTRTPARVGDSPGVAVDCSARELQVEPKALLGQDIASTAIAKEMDALPTSVTKTRSLGIITTLDGST